MDGRTAAAARSPLLSSPLRSSSSSDNRVLIIFSALGVGGGEAVAAAAATMPRLQPPLSVGHFDTGSNLKRVTGYIVYPYNLSKRAIMSESRKK